MSCEYFSRCLNKRCSSTNKDQVISKKICLPCKCPSEEDTKSDEIKLKPNEVKKICPPCKCPPEEDTKLDEINETKPKPLPEAGSELDDPPPPPDDETKPELKQFTSKHEKGTGGDACIEKLTSELGPGHTSHAPSGVDPAVVSAALWDAAKWDFKTTKDFCSMNMAAMCDWAFPSVDGGKHRVMRGLRQHFETIKPKPFADDKNPTPAEIDRWNLEVVKHFRKLWGISTPIENDRCQYLRAQWATERKETTVWDTGYPESYKAANVWAPYQPWFGPCPKGDPKADVHCGFTFIPSCEDQAPYLDPGEQCCPKGLAFAEGVMFVPKGLPWFMKLASVIQYRVCTEGRIGHADPFFSAIKQGNAFSCLGSPFSNIPDADGHRGQYQWVEPRKDPCNQNWVQKK
jgi:hypothetical protein